MPGQTSEAPALLAVDWGTSSLRAALLSAQGQPLEERSFAQGILQVPAGGFAKVFADRFGDWLRAHPLPCLISGMAGSRQGWLEAPYCPCPASFEALSEGVVWLPDLPWRIGLVPGLSLRHGAVPDVMRGEEVQIFGALRLCAGEADRFVLPGTHSKWAQLSGGRITAFSTWMSGEFYALLSQHSILSRTLDAAASFDVTAFGRGVRQAQHDASLLHSAFGTRALGLFGELPPSAQASYLSGLVIGEELRCQALSTSQTVQLIGSPTLTERYALALSLLGVPSRRHGHEATWAGLFGLHQILTESLS